MDYREQRRTVWETVQDGRGRTVLTVMVSGDRVFAPGLTPGERAAAESAHRAVSLRWAMEILQRAVNGGGLT